VWTSVETDATRATHRLGPRLPSGPKRPTLFAQETIETIPGHRWRPRRPSAVESAWTLTDQLGSIRDLSLRERARTIIQAGIDGNLLLAFGAQSPAADSSRTPLNCTRPKIEGRPPAFFDYEPGGYEPDTTRAFRIFWATEDPAIRLVKAGCQRISVLSSERYIVG